MLFSWVGTSLMDKGANQPFLFPDDLLPLTPALEPSECSDQMWTEWIKEIHQRSDLAKGKTQSSLLRVMIKLHGARFLLLALLKLSSDSLGFVAPLVLKHLVEWLSLPLEPLSDKGLEVRETCCQGIDLIPSTLPTPPTSSPPQGEGLAARGASLWTRRRSHARPLMPPPGNHHITVQLAHGQVNPPAPLAHFSFLTLFTLQHWRRMQCELRAAIMCLLYRKALAISSLGGHKGGHEGGGGGGDEDVSTLMSVDAGRVVNIFVSCNEIWGLPFQLIIALVLLYLQVTLQHPEPLNP